MKRGSSLQDLTWFLDLNKTGQLDLDPPYQRKSVWTLKDRTYFLDTIFKGYPSPAIFVHKETDDQGKTIYHVVDGKQRLQTILMFVQNEIHIGKDFGDQNFNNKIFDDLSTEQKQIFWNYVITVEFVESIETQSVNQIFDRLNRNSKNLNEQELRHAKYDGWFIREAEKEAENTFWEKVKISTKSKSKRMKDIQFISELLMVILENQLVGFNQDRITDVYAMYDDLSDNPEFEVDDYLVKKETVRKYVEEMENDSSCAITTWAKTANNFYTLWSLIVLYDGNLPPPKEVVIKYDSFMRRVSTMGDEIDSTSLSPYDSLVYNYYSNSRGASTDLKQRTERFDSLKKALLGHEGN